MSQPNGEVIITNDGATILNKMSVLQPAAKMLVELAKAQACCLLHLAAPLKGTLHMHACGAAMRGSQRRPNQATAACSVLCKAGGIHLCGVLGVVPRRMQGLQRRHAHGRGRMVRAGQL